MRSRGVDWALTRQDEDETRTDRQDGHMTTEAEAAAPTSQGAPAATRAGSSKKWPFPCGFRREPGPAGPSMWDLRPRELGESGLLLLSEPQAVPSPPEKPPGTAILCGTCGNVCRGEVLRVQDKYFHIECFVCKGERAGLCRRSVRQLQGQASGCREGHDAGLLPQALDFGNASGPGALSPEKAAAAPPCLKLDFRFRRASQAVAASPLLMWSSRGSLQALKKLHLLKRENHAALDWSFIQMLMKMQSCGGCGTEIKNGQSLVALDKHWHLGCFKCKTCGKQLNPDQLAPCRDGLPYCEADYHAEFGVRCDGCEKFITGHVLEAGEKHYHPLCAVCVRCGRMFAEGEEMYLQGSSRRRACFQFPPVPPSQETRASSESIVSVPASSTSGSPSRVIYAKLGDEVLDYRDLAALPRDKAIYNIDRPDMISYSPYISRMATDRQSYGESQQLGTAVEHKARERDESLLPLLRGQQVPLLIGIRPWGHIGPQAPPGALASTDRGNHTPAVPARPPPCLPPGAPGASVALAVLSWPALCCPAAGTVSVGASSCLSLSQHPSPTSAFRHHYVPYFRGSESGRSTPSLSMLSDSKPPPSTYQQAPRHFHIPDTGIKDNIYRKPPIYKQHASRRLDGEEGGFYSDDRKKASWLILKEDADTRTNSPELDSRSLSLSSGTDREPLQTVQGDSFYPRFPYSKSDPLPGHGRNGLDHRVGTSPLPSPVR
ncbi:actin-binding LIM protein 2 [Pteropus vampyrus]|uniref:Actin-binding LIM protein 2 n=1 Tax=Pteropus vampyrus TaxID=132908 RepID=A0A6P6BK66_PTEVA|nr:actin-binding LIM protein 2 [Pteropus vampyrus]